MFHWIHHLFNPHCNLCIMERECKSCNVLQQVIDQLRADNRYLLEQFSKNNEPKEMVISENVPQAPIGAGIITWNQKRRELEARSKLLNAQREADEKLAKENYQPRSIEEIETNLELGQN